MFVRMRPYRRETFNNFAHIKERFHATKFHAIDGTSLGT